MITIQDIENAHMHLGARVSYLRKERHLSQDALSSLAGIDRGYLIDIEKGRRNPTFDKLVRISQGLGLEVAVLLDGVSTKEVA